jgi:hypothetical protein
MSLPRALSKLISRVLIGVFVFAQMAAAGYACPGFGQPAQAIAMQAEASGTMPAGCDQMDQQAANLCAEHCHFGQQSSDTASVPVAFAPVAALLYVLPADLEGADGSGTDPSPPDPLLAAAPPPHAILHCVLRI